MGLSYYRDADATIKLRYDAMVDALNEMGSRIEVINMGGNTITVILTAPTLSKEERWEVPPELMMQIPLLVQQKTPTEFYTWLGEHGTLLYDGDVINGEENKPSAEHYQGCEVWTSEDQIVHNFSAEGLMADFFVWLPIVPSAFKNWAKDAQLHDNYNIDVDKIKTLMDQVSGRNMTDILQVKLEHLPGLKKPYPQLLDLFSAAMDALERFYQNDMDDAIRFLETLINKPTDNLSSVTLKYPITQPIDIDVWKKQVGDIVTGIGINKSSMGKHFRSIPEMRESFQLTIDQSHRMRELIRTMNTDQTISKFTKRYDELLRLLKRFPEIEVSDNVHDLIKSMTKYIAEGIEMSGFIFSQMQASAHRLTVTKLD